MMKFTSYMLLVLLCTTQVFAGDDYKKLNDKAADKYEQGEFDKARGLLEQAKEEQPGDPVVNYNLGSVQHQEGNYEDAGESLLNASMAEDSAMRSHAYYNIGNTEYRKGDYQKAVDAYKKSLATNPDDLDAKYNLELALKKLQEQQQQQQSECDKQQDGDNQDQENQDQQNQDQEQQDQQDERQDQQQQDQENQDQQEQQQQQQQEEQEQEDQQQQSSGGQEGDEQQQRQQQQQVQQAEMSEEDAERLLNAVTGNDREVLQKLVKMKAPAGAYSGKDW